MGEKIEKTRITIFSTKTIGEEGCLFGKSAKETAHDEQKIFLQNYFSRSFKIINQLEHLLKMENGNESLKNIFLKRINEIKEISGADSAENIAKLMTDGDNRIKEEYTLDDNEIAIKECLDDEIKTQNTIALCNRVNKWELRKELIDLCRDSKEWEKINKKSTMYQIYTSHVYALHCLEPEDMDKEMDQWLPCLIQCAHALTGRPSNGIDLQLVLHDAEFGRNTPFTKFDVMALDKNEDVTKAFPATQKFLDKNDECKILFFQHTTNPVTRILRTPIDDNNGDVIHEKVSDIILSYGRLGILKESSKKALDSENGIDESKMLDAKLIKLTKNL